MHSAVFVCEHTPGFKAYSFTTINQSMFYFMSVHTKVILDNKKHQNTHTHTHPHSPVHLHFYLLQQIAVGSIVWAQIWAHAVHTKGGQRGVV